MFLPYNFIGVKKYPLTYIEVSLIPLKRMGICFGKTSMLFDEDALDKAFLSICS